MTKPDPIDPLDDRLIDRIVDGELTTAELRAAIESLDRQPDGWKRCALAFLEAQCLSESFRLMEPATSSSAMTLAFSPPAIVRAGAGRRWVRGSIAAAVVAASFLLGWLGHAARPFEGEREPMIAGSSANPGLVADRSRPGDGASALPDKQDPQRFTSDQFDKPRRAPTVAEVVRAVARLHVGPQTTGADVPILAGPGINEQWLKSQPPPVTEYDQVALQRQGFQVNQRRQFYTMSLADGRRVAVPVDEVKIRYTGNDPL